jgi:hypothetical protein
MMSDQIHEPPRDVPLDVLRDLAIVDITYEVAQFTKWATESPPPSSSDPAQLLRRATFESAVMHHRNLTAFLSMARPPGHSHRRTDVVADHYFDAGWSNRNKHKRLFDAQSADRNTRAKHSVDVHLAHISSERVEQRRSDSAFSWHHVDLALIVHAFIEFTSDLAGAHPDRAAWFGESRDSFLAMRGTAATGYL